MLLDMGWFDEPTPPASPAGLPWPWYRFMPDMGARDRALNQDDEEYFLLLKR